LENDSVLGCINTNWIDSGIAQHFGAIVGTNNGGVSYCYYDNQMCIIGGVNNQDFPFEAEGSATSGMLGTSLQLLLKPPHINNGHGYGPGSNWVFTSNLYPRSSTDYNHPIVLLSAAPIYLQNGERVNNVTSNFTVSNGYLYPPLLNPYSNPYRWGSYSGGNYSANSTNGYIGILQPNIANIIMPHGGWDTLSVRLFNYVYPPYSNSAIFEKVVPINVK
jgi:hypothetical protein